MSSSKNPNLSTLKFLLDFVKPYKLRVFAALVALFFTAAITLSIGQGVKLLIDEGFAAKSTEQLNIAIAMLVTLSVLMAFGSSIRFYLVSWLGERVSADIRYKVFEHLISLHPSYFETNLSGEIMSRLTTDTTLLQSIIGSSFSMALRSAVTLLGAFTILLFTNLKLTAIISVGVPIVLLPLLLFGRRVRSLSRESQNSIAMVGQYAGEAIQNIKTVQSFTQELNEQRSFSKEVEKAFDIALRRIRQRASLIVCAVIAIFGAISAMLWSGGHDVLSGAMTAGELGAFIFYALMVAMSVATLSEVYGELQRAAGAAERLFELMSVPSLITGPADTQPDSQRPLGEIIASDLPSSVSLKDVEFSYPSRPEQAALHSFTLDIAQGECLALVGPSGAGKSTVFELLQRFYDPQAGEVNYGGVNVTSLEPTELRQQIAVVAQQSALFSTTVAENIRYGKPDASDDEVKAAALAAHADKFIMQLPQGYDSYLGERGVRLSGGQQQRLAIARAILKDPKVLLLDEATSALDAESEHQIQLALNELMQGRTTIIIAHRLATVQHADRIAVIENGQLLAQGSHNTLLKTSPLYQRLAALQFRDDTV